MPLMGGNLRRRLRSRITNHADRQAVVVAEWMLKGSNWLTFFAASVIVGFASGAFVGVAL